MKIVWRQRAEQQLDHQIRYLRQQNPYAAERALSRVHSRIAQLEQFPHLGRPSQRPGTRELLIRDTRFVAVYRVVGDAVEILAFFHTSQDR